MDDARHISPTTGERTLPVKELLTGRGFITGKSGSGKSNTAGVVVEELLERGYSLLVVDIEGEYHALAERYEVLHVGASEECDERVSPVDAPMVVDVALEEATPVVLDVSEYVDRDAADELVRAVVEELYRREKTVRKPFLLVVEETQEFLPQSGGRTELGELLERVAKRGRKRGLGMLGVSQRPSSVDKEFITQCDWLVWHRLTWQNDLDVVRKVLGSERADTVEGLDTGEALLLTDWDDAVERVRFRRKWTSDAGATPGLDRYDHAGAPTRSTTGADRGAPGTAGTAAVVSDEEPSSASAATPTAVETDDGDGEATGTTTATADAAPDGAGTGATARRREDAPPARTVTPGGGPRPPRPPEPHDGDHGDGVAGALVEFAAMVAYLSRVAAYRTRLAVHRVRTR
jgi:hypothetical protein